MPPCPLTRPSPAARASEVHRILGLELGADDYLAKPFSLFIALSTS
ncbi:CheY-like chemotaxis protein [Janthinobacterium sp. S3M3]|nr:CheY-like chemotaxis protein [Janthinobacterium sp. S3T4]MBB5611806.1 CheY-like chemotaxis protein [Janthinobacterium sp. S3M3]